MLLSFRKIIVIIIGLLIALCITGFLYQTIAIKLDAINYPAPGKLVDIGGYKLHINSFYPPTNAMQPALRSFNKVSPPVVMEAGTGSFSLLWEPVPAEISKFTTVYTYDRAGLGWSEESPLSRISANIISELHTLLEKVGIQKPFIMVGHSLGGGTIQLYANTYPDDVCGLVLVDSGHENIIEKMAEQHMRFERTITGFTVTDANSPQLAGQPLSQKLFLWLTSSKLGQIIAEYTGIQRLYLQSFCRKPGTVECPISPIINSRTVAPATFRTTSQEILDYPNSAQELRLSPDHLSNLPMIVIANGKGFFYNQLNHTHMSDIEIAFNQKVWDPLQRALAAKSSKGKLVIAHKSGHRIQDTEPELIVTAVKELVDGYKAKH